MSENPSSPPLRRPGAPLGNCNALKHGFYSRRFKEAELDAVHKAGFLSLADEIRALRRSVHAAVESSQSGDPEFDLLTLGGRLCVALISLDRLIRTHHLLATNKDVFLDTFNRVMED